MFVRHWFLVLLSLSFTLTVVIAAFNESQPEPLTEPPVERVACLSYAPYRLAGESPFDPSHMVTAERVEQDLRLLSKVTKCVRTYSTQQGIGLVPKVAQQLDMTVLLGIWIGRSDLENQLELNDGIALARQYPETIVGVIVGNEVLLRREQTAEAMAAYIDRMRNAVDIPVTYADVWEFWFKNESLARHVDYVTAHILPFWEDEPVGIEAAVPHVLDVYQHVVEKFPGKRIMIGETGWPSAGRMRGPAKPGRVEQARFIREWVTAATARSIDYNLIEAFDQPWKRRLEGAMGGHWGFLDSAGAQKFPWRGSVVGKPGALLATLCGLGLLAGVFVATWWRWTRWSTADSSTANASIRLLAIAASVGALTGSLLVAQVDYLITWNRFLAEWLGSVAFWLTGLAAALLLPGFVTGDTPLPTVRAALKSFVGRGRAATGAPERRLALGGLLRAVLLFGTAVFLLLHAFDARYRGFALEFYVAPLAIMLGFWLGGHTLPRDALEERWLGIVILLATPFMLLPEIPHNHEAWLLAALVLPIGAYPLLARQNEPLLRNSTMLASNAATAPGSTE